MRLVFLIRIFLCSALLVFCANNLHSQYTEQSRIQYTVDDGLPSNTCYNLIQDLNGFIWIASEGGLTKYDGQKFKKYGTKYGLTGTEVGSIQADNQNRIWLNSTGPLSYLKNDSLTRLNLENPNMNWNFQVHSAADNKLWICYKRDLLILNGDDLSTHNLVDQNVFKNNKLKNVIGEYNDTLWISLHKKIIKIYDDVVVDQFVLNSNETTYHNVASKYKLFYPYLIFSDDYGIQRLDVRDKTIKELSPESQLITSIKKFNDQIWMITDSKLFYIQIDEFFNPIKEVTILEGELISSFHFDKDENLWVCTNKNGIYLYPKQNKNIRNVIFQGTTNYLESVVYANDKILIGTNDSKIIELSEDTIVHEIIHSKDHGVNRVLDIIPLEENSFLYSTDSGISVLTDNEQNMKIETSTKNIFIKGKELLIGHYSTAFRSNLEDILSLDKGLKLTVLNKLDIVDTLLMDRTNSIIKDSKNNYWIGSVKNGLTKFEDSDTTFFAKTSNIFNSTVMRIEEGRDNLVCVATNGEGVILIKDDKYFQISDFNGLSSSKCNDLKVKDDLIIVPTNRGVNIISDLNFETKVFKIQTISKENGLLSQEIHAVDKFEDTLYLATNKGLSIVSLEDNLINKNNNQVFIEEFQVNNEPLSFSENIELEHNQNNILIKYTSPQYSSSRNPTFKYKLKGLDEQWIVTNSTERHYSQLPAGNYIFSVGLADNSGDAATKDFSFSIKPLFTDTTAFKYLLSLLALFLLYVIFEYRSNTKQKKILAVKVEEKTKELNEKIEELAQTNQKLSKSNLELEQFTYIASHDLQEPLNTINGFNTLLKKNLGDSLDESSKTYLKIINDSSIRMKSLVDEILTFSRIGREKSISNVDCNLLLEGISEDLFHTIKETNTQIKYSSLPTIKAYPTEFRLLFQNLISNGIKFQKQGQSPIIEITHKENANDITFSIKDNGIGISPKHQEKIFTIFQRLNAKEKFKGTGIGLSHCKKIVELHKGDIWVESVIDNGSVFHFTISKDL